LAFHVLDPALEESRDRHSGRVNAGAVLRLGQEPSALDLRLALRASERMPAALPLAGLRIAHVDDYRPLAG
jgi:hypothetical protein